jgi:hypothetical protein
MHMPVCEHARTHMRARVAGAEANLTGVDVHQSKRAGVFVLHQDSACTLHLCRITGASLPVPGPPPTARTLSPLPV